MKAWTDYPFIELGDISNQQAPIREVTVMAYDGDKYCAVIVEGRVLDVKAGYLYKSPGRLGKVESIDTDAINPKHRVDSKQNDHELPRITIDGTPIGPPLQRHELIQSWLETSLEKLTAILAKKR